MKNRIAALSLTLALSVGLCAPAQAADSQTVQATLNAGITVTMDGTPQTFHDAQGAVVLPVTYSGTTYLPVRAVSALVGLGVEWEAETQTVKLTTPETPTPATSPADGTGDGFTSQTVPALLNGSITVTLDGAAQTFHDAQGAVVLPLTYNGTTYLPVRAVCGLVGLPVEWVQETSTVKLGEAPTAELPEGAVAVTPEMDIYRDGHDYTYENGAYVCSNGGAMSTGTSVYFETKGYKYVTATFTAGDLPHWFGVYDGNKSEGGWLSPDVDKQVAAGETMTITTDISSTTYVYVRVMSGRMSDGTITELYLHN